MYTEVQGQIIHLFSKAPAPPLTCASIVQPDVKSPVKHVNVQRQTGRQGPADRKIKTPIKTRDYFVELTKKWSLVDLQQAKLALDGSRMANNKARSGRSIIPISQ